MDTDQLQERKVALLRREAELVEAIQKINLQLKANPVNAENKDWHHRAGDAKRYRLKELSEVHIELSQINSQLEKSRFKIAAAFFDASKEVLPDDLFGKIMQLATTTLN
jgi:hypothetical protein